MSPHDSRSLDFDSLSESGNGHGIMTPKQPAS